MDISHPIDIALLWSELLVERIIARGIIGVTNKFCKPEK